MTVAIVMGSSSDWPVMEPAADVLRESGVAHEVAVVSAHRDPHGMLTFGRDASRLGFTVIIAGAGGAAHLPGMLAAATTRPVIGVPVARPHLDGLDSLLSIVQMPTGVPVATVGVNAAANAALLALRILGVADGNVEQLVAERQAALQAHSAEGNRAVATRWTPSE
jgi:5-(carboxyamino)imidazole ribonucleotide mutase